MPIFVQYFNAIKAENGIAGLEESFRTIRLMCRTRMTPACLTSQHHVIYPKG